ncbi:hypothetical protein JY651_22715 [Pyxidicoccus parkwayensis]|uniref:Big-1 domain-containing protein n=1 Tax=Pyxidicoccus parkwayensis TaxID=2813578 RepID=A0ABX7PAQ4_9BACT|nr:hypothetical protein [Pyxidicoccus parkwaysis]QSQ27551.1 hypothetical protein JY651_22715 [Pyxidicoccus parkwaysis]
MSLKNLALVLFTGALILSGCGGSKPPEQPVAKKLAFTVQPSQAVAGAVIAPAVKVSVLTAEGNVVPGAQVTVSLSLEANPSGATLSGAAPAATSQGVATFASLALDKAGEGYTLVARAQGLDSATSQAFTITAAQVIAHDLAFTQQPGELEAGGTFSPSVQVTVRDAAGAPVPMSVPVTLALSANPAGGMLSGTLTANTTNGVATFPELSLDKAGEGYVLTASAPGVEPANSAAFKVKPGKAKSMAFVSQPASAAVDAALTPAVQVRLMDAHGNVATGATDSITVALGNNDNGATLSGTLTVAAVEGVASFAGLSVDHVGTYTLVASGTGLEGATSNSFDITGGPATQLSFRVQPSTVGAGSAFSPAVEVTALDAKGNVSTGFTGPVTVALDANPTSDTLQGTLTVNAVAGVARFSNVSLRKLGTGYTLVASSSGLTSATSQAFDVTPGEARVLTFTKQPGESTVGAPINPPVAVTVRDGFGNTVTNSSATLTLSLANNPTGASLTGTVAVAAVNGVATFTGVAVDKAGNGYTLSVSAPGLTSTSIAFNVVPGVATKLAFGVQPSDVVAGSSITPAVTVRVVDAAGNTVPTATNSITMAIGNNPNSGILNGTKTVSAVNGVATFPGLSITKTGAGYTLTAAATGLTGGTSSAFNVTPGAASSLGFDTNPPSVVTAGAAITPAVKVSVRDAFNNTVTGSTASITLSMSANPGASTLGGTLTVNAVNGVATFPDLTLDKVANNYSFAAASTGLTGTTSTLFNVAAGAASKLAFTTQPANVAAGATFATSVKVTVQDAFGNTVTTPAVSVGVALGNNPSGATLGGTTTATTASGVATFANITVDKLGTGYTLVAASSPLTGVTSNAFNVTAGPASKLAFITPPGNTTAGTAFNPAVQVAVQDAGGNTVTGSTASITLGLGTNPSGAALSGTLVVSAVNGVATFSGVSLARVGTGYTLTATSTGLTAGTSPAFNVTAGPASKLVFTGQPSRASVGQAITPAVEVTVQDGFGNTVTSSTDSITVALGNNPSGATLGGTLTVSATNGVASFAGLTVSAAGNGYTLTVNATGLQSATSIAFDAVVAGTKLVYVDPAAPGRKIALVRNPASTDTTVLLDLVALENLTGYSVGMNLPLDTTLVQAAGSLMVPGTVLAPGQNPIAAYGKLPASGPLAGTLTTGQSQKAAGEGAVTTDTAITAGSVLYTVQLAMRPGATSGVVFDGAALGPKFRALMRDRLGTDVVDGSGFAIGRLEVQ